MSSAASNRTPAEGSFRDRMHSLLRESILDAATARLMKVDWSQVRIADIAEDVGVSRQTIYNEFGSKDQLGRALFEREMAEYLVGLLEVMEETSDIRGAVRAAVAWILAQTRSNEMLQRTLRDARKGTAGQETLLPLMTVNAHQVMLPAREALAEYFESRWPAPDGEERATLLVEIVIRFVMSFMIAPSDQPEEVMVDLIADMVARSLGLTHV